jgi:deglycase
MQNERLSDFRVAVLATDFFEESELTEPRKALEEAGAVTVVIAPHAGEIKAVHHDQVTGSVKVDQTLSEADPEKFDALLLPGGRKNSAALRDDPLARDFVRFIGQMHRPIAAICHGGWLLIPTLLVKGRHVTSYPAIREDFEKAGAFWTDKAAVHDGNLVTSRQPADIPQFNHEMLSLFIDHKHRSRTAA